MTEPLTFGVVGCGEITSLRRADELAAAENAEIGVAMDVVEHLARDIGDRFDVPWTTEYDAVLSNPAIDAVYLAVPHDLHAPQAIRAAEAGRHVLVEKPIATSVAEADEMIATCDEAGVTLGVFLVRRYSATHERVRELVTAGAIGDVVGTDVEIMIDKDDSYWESGYTGRVQTDWRKDAERSGGGVLSINGIHNADALRDITGLEAVRVAAEYDTFATDVEVEDLASVTMRYDSGAIGSIRAGSFAVGSPPDETVGGDRIYGTEGTIIHADPIRIRTTTEEYGEPGTWSSIEVSSAEAPGTRLFEDYVASVRAGEQPRASGPEAMRSLEVIEAAYRAGETGETVELPLAR